MSDNFFRDLNIPIPDYNIHVGSGTHEKQTGLMMNALKKYFWMKNQILFLVQGDTNAILAGFIVASKLHIAISMLKQD